MRSAAEQDEQGQQQQEEVDECNKEHQEEQATHVNGENSTTTTTNDGSVVVNVGVSVNHPSSDDIGGSSTNLIAAHTSSPSSQVVSATAAAAAAPTPKSPVPSQLVASSSRTTTPNVHPPSSPSLSMKAAAITGVTSSSLSPQSQLRQTSFKSTTAAAASTMPSSGSSKIRTSLSQNHLQQQQEQQQQEHSQRTYLSSSAMLLRGGGGVHSSRSNPYHDSSNNNSNMNRSGSLNTMELLRRKQLLSSSFSNDEGHPNEEPFITTMKLRRPGEWRMVETTLDSPPPPCQRSLHSTALLEDKMYIFGGYDGTTRVNDFFSYDFMSRRWNSIRGDGQPPSPRDRHVSVCHNNKFYVFGGFDGRSRVNDFFCYDFRRHLWTPVVVEAGNPPSPRHSHAAVVHGDTLLIFGGYDGSYRSDLNEFHFISKTWSNVVTTGRSPRARYRSTCCVMNNNNTNGSSSSFMIVFGGHDGTRHLCDTHLLDLNTKCWTALPLAQGSIPPSPRDSHVSVIHSSSSETNTMYVFGGSTGAAMNDLHKLQLIDLRSNSDYSPSAQHHSHHHPHVLDHYQASWTPVIPSATSEHNTAAATARHRFCHVGVCYDHSFYVFGGYDGTHRLNDFIQFDFHDPDGDGGDDDGSTLDKRDGTNASTDPFQLTNHLHHMVNNPELSDVTFIVEGETVYAHKFMLIRSNYFRAMFLGEMREANSSSSDNNNITLTLGDHISLEVFLVVLEFLYTDRDISIPLDHALEVFAAADEFCIPRLKLLCEKNIFMKINIDNAASIFLASDLYSAAALKERTLQYILRNFEQVSKSTAFEEMARTNVELVFEILRKR